MVTRVKLSPKRTPASGELPPISIRDLGLPRSITAAGEAPETLQIRGNHEKGANGPSALLKSAPRASVDEFRMLPFSPTEMLSAPELDAYEERAAIMEYEAHLPTLQAELLTLEGLLQGRPHTDPTSTILVEEFDAVELCGTLEGSFPIFTEDEEDEASRLSNTTRTRRIGRTAPPWDRLSGTRVPRR